MPGRRPSRPSRALRRAMRRGDMTRVIVIGAGVAGLCTAPTLQERGAATTLVERSANFGEGAVRGSRAACSRPSARARARPRTSCDSARARSIGGRPRRPTSRAPARWSSPARATSAEIDRFAARTRGHERRGRRGDRRARAGARRTLPPRPVFPPTKDISIRARRCGRCSPGSGPCGGVARFGTEMRDSPGL